jgi:putative ABC transport system substrate-binding protein
MVADHQGCRHQGGVGDAQVLSTRSEVAVRFPRRRFLHLTAGAAALPVAWPLAARAQQPALPVIGFLGALTPSTATKWTAAFVQRLRELGWIEDRTIAIDYRWAGGLSERAAEIAAEFVRLKVNVIVTHANETVMAAMRATSVIPIVFAAAGDPVGAGLVASLARPGGNVTGLSVQQTDLGAKRLELIREVVPNLRRLAILANIGNPGAVLEMREVQSAASGLGLDVATFEIQQLEDIAPTFEVLKSRADTIYVVSDPLTNTNRARIVTLALEVRLPTIYNFRENVEAGGLMSYGPNIPDLFRRAAEFVDKILRGAKPADIPVEQPTKFDLVVNLTTAKALGLKIPESFLARADEVIE